MDAFLFVDQSRTMKNFEQTICFYFIFFLFPAWVIQFVEIRIIWGKLESAVKTPKRPLRWTGVLLFLIKSKKDKNSPLRPFSVKLQAYSNGFGEKRIILRIFSYFFFLFFPFLFLKFSALIILRTPKNSSIFEPK